ncbi:hypothetical protein J0X15_16375 [Roseibium sp. CAU 1637]|uniref:Capsule biosynthesis protein n=1 Tax=Roseibium limicola TaxID=2816037 RepID=A0A939ETF9_9HYPH|nr:hypothetical protein [Roseibium limicola]MBO0346804.1 hypothetical protein [Roseibium limicola]
MADDSQQLTETGGRSLTVRSQKMAAALSSYARALTFENRSRRNLYRLAGLAPRVRDKIFAKLLIIAFIFCFALPFSACVLYYTVIASEVYSSEVRFVVRSSAPMLSRDRYSTETVEPKAKIVQDTAIVLNYLDSPAMVRELKKTIDFDHMFGRSEIDYFSRYSTDSSAEQTRKYWENMFSSWVNPKSGIVELEVNAFSPEEVYELMLRVLDLAEARINKLNSGMWDSLLISSRQDVETATDRLADLREKFRLLQNETGIYDVTLAADSIIDVLTKLESGTAEVKSQREALVQSIGPETPQVKQLDREIAAREEQAAKLKAQAAGPDNGSGGNLASTSQVFDQISTEITIAEDRLESAIKELEKVKLVSSLQLVFLDVFTEPTEPDTSKYPNVAFSLFVSLLIFLSLWGAIAGTIIYIRQKMD